MADYLIDRRALQGQLKGVRRHHYYDENDVVRVLVVLAIDYSNSHFNTRQIEIRCAIPLATSWKI